MYPTPFLTNIYCTFLIAYTFPFHLFGTGSSNWRRDIPFEYGNGSGYWSVLFSRRNYKKCLRVDQCQLRLRKYLPTLPDSNLSFVADPFPSVSATLVWWGPWSSGSVLPVDRQCFRKEIRRISRGGNGWAGMWMHGTVECLTAGQPIRTTIPLLVIPSYWNALTPNLNNLNGSRKLGRCWRLDYRFPQQVPIT